MFKSIADQRVEQLQKKETLNFYESLAKYTPKPKVESPRNQLGKLGGLPENPPDEPLVPTAPVRPKDSGQQGPGLGIPVPSLSPTESPKPSGSTAEPAKPPAANSGVSIPTVSTSAAAKSDTAKPEASKGK